jgi:hypothetical protein
MLAAEFSYSWEFTDNEMDFDRFITHLEYREQCPPAGMMLKAIIESLGDGDKVSIEAPPVNVREEIVDDTAFGGIAKGKPNLAKFLKDVSAAGFSVK